jgi:hypothetical protein
MISASFLVPLRLECTDQELIRPCYFRTEPRRRELLGSKRSSRIGTALEQDCHSRMQCLHFHSTHCATS